jgi:PAS domain S-box-containing protein
MPEPHRAQHDGYLVSYARTGVTHILGRTREFEVVRKDGRRIPVELSVSRADVPGREEPVFTGAFRDISQRREAEHALGETRRRLQAIFDQSFQSIAILDASGTVIDVNDVSLRSTGRRREEILGKALWASGWWPDGDSTPEKLRTPIRQAARGETVRFDLSMHLADGEVLDYDVSIKPVHDDAGAVTLIVFEGREVTELRRAQRSETAMLRGLAEIGESAAVLVHEIKNPITGIQAALKAVAEELQTNHRAVLEDLVQRLRKVEHAMRRTLSFARPVTPRRRSCDLAELVHTTIDGLRPLAAQARVERELELAEGLPALELDPQLVGEVLANMVHNALEALQELERAGRVRIALTGDESALEMAVEDDGPGIPESRRAVVFRPFHTTKAKGTGLGLAHCKKVIEEHGGSIAVERSALGGAAFRIRFPIDHA